MFRRFVKHHTLWAGLLAVALPLGVLLSLQYFWLVDLQKKSAIAEKAYLENYLATVTSRVEYFYRKQGERTLNVPGSLFRMATPEKIAYYLRKRQPEGAKAFFIVNLVNSDWDDVVIYDPRREQFTDRMDSGMVQAIFVAVAPWRTLAWKGATIRSQGVSIDARDPGNRILFNPITDDDSQLLGVMGMIVDNDRFRREILPQAIHESVPGCEDSGPRGQLRVSVHDADGHLTLGQGSSDDPASEARGSLGFLFPDWEISIGGGNMTPEEFAKSNFLINLSLSALLALALLGGIVMALRVASREIRLSEMKSDFVSNVTHELRTPLASIRVFGEFLRLGRARSLEKTQEYGEYIETESRRLTQLINNILDFSKIESGAKTYDLQPAAIERIVAEAARTLAVGLSHKGFRLALRAPEEDLPAVELDPDAITQAVSNLVDNAVKYSREPGEIRLSLTRRNGSALITVEDDGIGISRDEQGKIFERFHRVSTGLVHNVKGSGLGLAIVSHIAKAHGGSVSVESTPGRGSRFTIALPFIEPAPGLTAQSEES